MSYVLHVWQSPLPRNEGESWEIIKRLLREQDEGLRQTPPALPEFLRRITARYPDLMDIPDDEDGVWSDGPMQAEGPIEIVGIRPSCVDEVQPFVVAQAVTLGLACYDMQIGRLYLPGAGPGSQYESKWWQFWKRSTAPAGNRRPDRP
jgi:hypothetical protein